MTEFGDENCVTLSLFVILSTVEGSSGSERPGTNQDAPFLRSDSGQAENSG